MVSQEKLKGRFLTLAASILFAINILVFRYLLPKHVQPEASTNMRMSFACVMFWIISLFVPYERVPLKDLGPLYLCTLCGIDLNQGLFIQGLNTISPVDISIIATTVPISVIILAALILKEPITRVKTFGILLGICGVTSLVLQSTQGSDQASSLGGNPLITVSGFMYSIYLVVSKSLTLKCSSVTMMKWMFLFFTLITLPFAIESIWNTPTFHKEVLDGQELGAIFFMLFGATFVPYLLIPLAPERIHLTTVSMYNYIQPIVASFITVFAGQDSFGVTKLVSAALVFSGVYLVAQSKNRMGLEQQNSQSFDKSACSMKNNA